MKKFNRKGFTLIELLAVIVILGVLLAIAVPAVTKYINSSKQDAFVSDVKNYIDSARNEALNAQYAFPVAQYDATVISFKDIQGKLEKGGKTTSYGGTYNENNSCVIIVNEGTAEEPKYVYYAAALDNKGYGLGTSGTAKNIEYNTLARANVVQLSSGFVCNKALNKEIFKIGSNTVKVTSTIYTNTVQ